MDLRRPVDPELLASMCQALRHRGPDARGIHCHGGVGLGVQRLAVIDLLTGDQPIYNENGTIVVVLNGEIYNYVELREMLIGRGHTFLTQTDTETVVHLYEEFGSGCVEHLRGMFAFAIWDEPRRRLLLARDRVGKKPLFFRVAPQAIWFASEPRAILQDPEVPREPDFDAIDTYLRFQYVPAPLSAFKSLRKLPPAHVLEWDGGEPTVSRYWRLDYRPSAVGSRAEAAEMVRESLLEATKLRLRADVPVGAFLSGGVDSSAVVAAMARAGAGTIKTFSVGFDRADHDETAYARQVAEGYGTEHHEIRLGPEAMVALPQLVWHYGEPFADSSALPTFHLSSLTSGHVKVALTGDGGDESFAGYSRYAAQLLTDSLSVLPTAVLRAIARPAEPIGSRLRTGSIGQRAARGLVGLGLAPAQNYDRMVSTFTRQALDDLYEPPFARQLPASRTADRHIAGAWLDSQSPDTIGVLLDVDVQTYLPGDLLVKMDVATMAHSLEVRSPFLDHVLMERVASLPGELKLSRFRTKLLLKEAMAPWIPASVIDRRKMGFAVPIGAWFRDSLAQLPGEVLMDPIATSRGIFRPDRVERMIDEHRSGKLDRAAQLWALMQLELWYRTYIDPAQPQPVVLDVGRR